jgi:hypothetical protein
MPALGITSYERKANMMHDLCRAWMQIGMMGYLYLERSHNMAEIKKHVDDSLYCIRHALRELPPGKMHGNEDIDTTLTAEKNYSLLHGRCHTADEANQYRKDLEKGIFKYKRKGLVRTIEIIIQCPADCTDKNSFFETSYNYVCNKVLPMGEKSVIVAQVHGDEHKYLKDENGNFKLDENGEKIDISKEHLHIIAVPASRDTKHPDYEWKLSAHDLTGKSRLRQFHPGLQKACDDAGIKATVYTPQKSGDGKTIALSVAQLKEITNKTGIVIDKSLTIDKLAEILATNRDVQILNQNLQKKIDQYISHNHDIEHQLNDKDHTISDLKKELEESKQKIRELEASKVQERTWGNEQSWGNNTSWGNEKNWGETTINQEEKLW